MKSKMEEENEFKSIAGRLIAGSDGPPDELRSRTTRRVVNLRDGVRPAQRKRVLMNSLAAAAMFAIGFLSCWLWFTSAAHSGNEYLLLLFDGGNFRPPDPSAIRHEYGRWMSQAHEVQVMTGKELADNRSIAGDTTVVPLSASGFFIVRADSEEQVRRIAATTPHARYGGIVEIKQIIP